MELLSIAPEAQLAYVKQRFGELSPEERGIAESLFSLGYEMGNDKRFQARHKQIERYCAFTIGVLFVAALLAINIWIPNPSPTQATTFRIVLALAGAGFGAFIPGFLNVSVGNFARAGGALAIFLIVYFWDPASRQVDSRPATDPAPPTASEQSPPS